MMDYRNTSTQKQKSSLKRINDRALNIRHTGGSRFEASAPLPLLLYHTVFSVRNEVQALHTVVKIFNRQPDKPLVWTVLCSLSC